MCCDTGFFGATAFYIAVISTQESKKGKTKFQYIIIISSADNPRTYSGQGGGGRDKVAALTLITLT